MIYHLKELRIRMGFSQSQLAEMVHISRQAYTLYELGKRSPSVEVLRNLSRILNVTSDYLLQEDADENPHDMTGDEKRVLDIYRRLDSRGRQTVQTMMVFEHIRFGGEDIPPGT